MINRSFYLSEITRGIDNFPAIALLGPRQCGKTTLARAHAKIVPQVHFFDLENPMDLARLSSPLLALQNLEGLIVIDEIQKRPELFPVLRVLIDSHKDKQRYLILGSASRDLIQQSSETLAGRIKYIELPPLSLFEIDNAERLWLRGGFPDSFLAKDDVTSFEWREAYVATFLERDIPALGINIPPMTLRRFWLMLLHYHGQIFNASEIGNALGLSHTTIRRYLDILMGTFMIRVLPSWQENIGKRQVKAPKIYFRDSGIMHCLSNIASLDDLNHAPRLGASWEGFALEELIRGDHFKQEECYFWRTHTGAELDLLVHAHGKRLGFEFKYTDHPTMTKSMHSALADLKLDQLTVVVPGEADFPLAEKVRVLGLERLTTKAII